MRVRHTYLLITLTKPVTINRGSATVNVRETEIEFPIESVVDPGGSRGIMCLKVKRIKTHPRIENPEFELEFAGGKSARVPYDLVEAFDLQEQWSH